MRKTIGILLMLPFLVWAGARIYNTIVFDINVQGHLKRAADANTIELAKNEIATAILYLEKNGMTDGYTSILYRTPDEDVGFWYNNLKASLGELNKISPDATQLEKSNILIKLRETLLDQGDKSVKVTVPPGISVFPNNTAYAAWAWVGGFLVVIGVFLFVLGLDYD